MPEPAHLDQAGERVGRPHQQAAMRGLHMDAIVADQPRERERAGRAGLDQRERKARFPEPAGPRISTARAPTRTAEAWMVVIARFVRATAAPR